MPMENNNPQKLYNSLTTWVVRVVIGLPIVIAILMAAFIPTLSFLSHPKYDFVYIANGKSYAAEGISIFTVTGDGMVQLHPMVDKIKRTLYTQDDKKMPQWAKEELKGLLDKISRVQLYIFDVKNMKSYPLSLDEFRRLQVKSSKESPDGYVFKELKNIRFPFTLLTRAREGDYALVNLESFSIIRLPISDKKPMFVGWVIK